ncbi:hypothetical protein [Plantactinospora endophytica]|uniref:Uncharacterized protein n=1 Tax=Plantactinospora endophytica TaxID=673535 RepID=A0ABQ4EF36_9ACTN|nr:hypothetical protein [Plantactinospora endophytica]GIG93315.1 hypothetical protein Pen02_82510 [Plantactinospora endophytica]
MEEEQPNRRDAQRVATLTALATLVSALAALVSAINGCSPT